MDWRKYVITQQCRKQTAVMISAVMISFFGSKLLLYGLKGFLTRALSFFIGDSFGQKSFVRLPSKSSAPRAAV